MAIALKIKSGLRTNQIVPLEANLIIGRSPDVTLPFSDAKMSSQHVQFKLTPQGWLASDLGSKNGFRFNGKKTKESIVIPGSYLKIGDTEFEVVSVDAPPKKPAKTIKEPPATGFKTEPRRFEPSPIQNSIALEETASSVAPVKVERLSWPEYFAQFVQMSAEKVKSRPREIMPFQRAIQLNVMKGLQSETVWTLGYGPREVGPHSVDLVIEDPGAPPICFSVFEKDAHIHFVTDRPDVVLLNNASVKTDTLEDGDLISFASTTIKFSFIE